MSIAIMLITPTEQNQAPQEEFSFVRWAHCLHRAQVDRREENASSVDHAGMQPLMEGIIVCPSSSTLLGDNKTTFSIKAHQECYKPNVISKVGTISGNPERRGKK